MAAITPPKAKAELWLRNWLAEHDDNPGFDAVMAVIRDGSWAEDWDIHGRRRGEYIHFTGTDAHGFIPPEFWKYVEVYLGRKIPTNVRATGFSCSC